MNGKTCTQFVVLMLLSAGKCVFSCRFGATALPSDLTPTKSDSYSESSPKRLLGSLPYTNCLPSRSETLLRFSQQIYFYGEGLLAAHPIRKLEDHPLLLVRGFLFDVSAATLQSWRPFLRTRHAVTSPCSQCSGLAQRTDLLSLSHLVVSFGRNLSIIFPKERSSEQSDRKLSLTEM
jgi:hypothetical protein